jgi:hypothetical protein
MKVLPWPKNDVDAARRLLAEGRYLACTFRGVDAFLGPLEWGGGFYTSEPHGIDLNMMLWL